MKGFRIDAKVHPSARLDEKIFQNQAGFNEIVIYCRDSWPPTGYEDRPDKYVVGVNQFGIVLSSDEVSGVHGETAPGEALFGYHNVVVPWSNILCVYQYIAT